MRPLAIALTALIPSAWAVPKPQADPAPVSRACGDLIRAANGAQYGVVDAVTVSDCWATVPFIPAVATRFIKYWNDTLQFHSSLDYLRSPPASYQKPAVDLLAGLQRIQDTINNDGYQGQYEFEADLQRVLYSANDNHVELSAGLLSSFTFGSKWGLTSLSLDGLSLPKIYLTRDLYLNQTKPASDVWQPSAVSQINGQDVVQFLSEFAAVNSEGTLEPHADWNTLLDSPVQYVLLEPSVWSGAATFYPGDTLVYTFENGSSLTDKWLGISSVHGDTGPLETGGDFYNFFVLGLYPASYDGDSAVPSNYTPFVPYPSSSFIDYTSAYPSNPAVYQANLTVTGYTTGYMITEASLAVLSIPTFYATGADIQAFSDTIERFLIQAKARGMRKILIDLQQNTGGDVLLAHNTFKQFFPAIEPFAASKRRANPLAYSMGNTITNWWNSLSPTDPTYVQTASDEWIAMVRLNALTGQQFSSASELFSPSYDGVGYFMTPERLNTRNQVFDYDALGEVKPPAPLLTSSQANPYAASDIMILSDALCSSSCALFMEMMQHDAGVRTVVVGGRPEYGPMQAPSQSRAARGYSLYELDADINNTVTINPTVQAPNRADQTLFVEYGGISLRDQVRQNEQTPLSMKYEAADCRIFLTPDTFDNFTNLWKYASDALWFDPGKCVQGSTGYSTTSPSSSTVLPPPTVSIPEGVTYNEDGILVSTNRTSGPIHFIESNEPFLDSGVAVGRTEGGMDAEAPVDSDDAYSHEHATFDQASPDKKRRKRSLITTTTTTSSGTRMIKRRDADARISRREVRRRKRLAHHPELRIDRF